MTPLMTVRAPETAEMVIADAERQSTGRAGGSQLAVTDRLLTVDDLTSLMT